jgi:dTDP-4-dehydrorhamnose 3,5-epimerase
MQLIIRYLEFRGRQVIVEEDPEIPGPMVIKVAKFSDERGQFVESFNSEFFRRTLGLCLNIEQSNYSSSKKNVFRGMHMQRRKPQGKLVSCLSGSIKDYVLDLRPGKTMGKFFSKVLETDSEWTTMMWAPPGFAHGFHSLDHSLVHYLCSELYDQRSDGGVSPLSCGIPLPDDLLISAKDLNLPSLVDYRKIYG